METLALLLVLLAVTRAFGEVAHRMGQPALLGELLAGVALGAVITASASFMPALGGIGDSPGLHAFTDLGIFFLMLYGGVELRASELARISARAFVIAACGLIVPVMVGFSLAWLFLPDSDIKVTQALLVGTALAITAVPVSIRVLMDLGRLNTPAGQTIVAAAIIDDVLSLLLLGVLTGMMSNGGEVSWTGLGVLAAEVTVFFAVVLGVGRGIVPWVGRVVTSLKTAEFEFSSLVLAALVFGALAELLHLHFVLGAFVAGLLFERRVAGEVVYQQVKERLSAVTFGLFAPIFFATIGLHLDLGAVTRIPVFLVLLIVVAFATKLVGAGVPAYLLGHSGRDAVAVGVGMSARGAVELIIADVALRAGVFSLPDPPPPVVANLFSAIVIVALVTTVATPLILRRVFVPEVAAAPGSAEESLTPQLP